MTLIVYKRVGPLPFILSDALVSDSTKRMPDADLPGNFHSFQQLPDQRVVGLYQKTLLFNDRMALAWSGNYATARRFTLALNEIAGEYPAPDRIEALFNDLRFKPEEVSGVSLICLVVTRLEGKDHDYALWAKNVRRSVASAAQETLFAGSGWQHFERARPARRGRLTSNAEEAIYPFVDAISEIVLQSAQVLHEEMQGAENLSHLYGGSFELVVPDEERGLVKVPMSQVFWEETSTSLELSGPVFSPWYTPCGVMCLRRFVLESNGWIRKDYLIPNFLNEQNAPDICAPDDPFTISTVHHFMSRAITKDIHCWGKDPLLKLYTDGGNILAQVKPEVLKMLEDWD